MAKWLISTINFYRSTLNSSINATDETWTFDVLNETVDWYTLPTTWLYWIIVDFWDNDEMEIFRITSRAGKTLTYDKRISPKWKFTHSAWELIQLNDFAETINFVSKNIDTTWLVESIPWAGNELKVKVYGWRIYKEWGIDPEIADTILTLADSSTHYIFIDDNTYTFSSTTIEPTTYYVIAKVVTAAWTISSIDDYRSNIVSPWSSGGWSGWHTIKDTQRDSDTPDTTYTQRDALAFRKFWVSDDWTNLQTIIENQWLWTPDVVPAWETIYCDADTQLVVEWGITVNGTLVMDGKLVVL